MRDRGIIGGDSFERIYKIIRIANGMTIMVAHGKFGSVIMRHI